MRNIKTIENKIFSQHGEDGIINFLSSNLINNSYNFVEIGCGNGIENNSRNLFNNNWHGVICDNNKNINQYLNILKVTIKTEQVHACVGLIDLENINSLINIIKDKDIAFLSLDIDSYDYFILKEIFRNKIFPKILCLEYNCFLTGTNSVKYFKNFDRRKIDKLYGLYFGCSLDAYKTLCKKNNYIFFSTDSSGTNGFFYLKDHFRDEINNIYKIDFMYNEYYVKKHQLKYKLTAKQLEEYLLNNFAKDLVDVEKLI
jgi:hypothetical protein